MNFLVGFTAGSPPGLEAPAFPSRPGRWVACSQFLGPASRAPAAPLGRSEPVSGTAGPAGPATLASGKVSAEKLPGQVSRQPWPLATRGWQHRPALGPVDPGIQGVLGLVPCRRLSALVHPLRVLRLRLAGSHLSHARPARQGKQHRGGKCLHKGHTAPRAQAGTGT